MTYDIYRYIFIGAAILSGILFLVSVLVFILMNIPKVISDLSGATARKAIRQIREQNEASGDKGYKVSAFNEARGKLTDKISPSGNVVKQYHQSQMRGIHTSKISTQQLPPEALPVQPEMAAPANETSVLGTTGSLAPNETTVLGTTGSLAPNETTVLGTTGSLAPNETTVLGNTAALAFEKTAEIGNTADLAPATAGETSVLSPVIPMAIFRVEYEVTYVHTAEVIRREVAV